MEHWQDRTRLLIGDEGINTLKSKHVLVVGLGGVGAYAAEQLARAGIGRMTIVDGDVVVASNINRQLPALTNTIGRTKVDVMRERLMLINPEAEIVAICGRYNADTAATFHLEEYEYVIDAIDSLADKALLINSVSRLPHTELFSSMGAARKLDPSRIRIAEFRKITGDPLARALRQRFKQLGAFPERKFLCVYSDEIIPPTQPLSPAQPAEASSDRPETLPKQPRPNGTLAHITVIFGNMLASLVIRDRIAGKCLAV